jgi:cytochrome c2
MVDITHKKREVSKPLIVVWCLWAGLCASNLTPVQGGMIDHTPNPHSDLIFRATGATSCTDCHALDKSGAMIAHPLDNDLVRKLRDKAKGIHGPGRFADCLRCHAGGSKGVEKY